MGKIYVIADLHLGHINIATRWRGFQDEFYMNEHIVKCWNEVVNKRDTVWILGDITMENSRDYYVLDRLNGIKKVVLGNHDKPSNIKELLTYVNCVSGGFQHKNAWLTHIPVHPSEIENIRSIDVNIHGHVHENSIDDSRYINVSAENVNYKPQLLSKLLEL
jgi:calcineurin-like phosphoesterase family protein